MSQTHRDDDHGSHDDHDDQGAALSEGGSGALNADTSQGGADSVPDTPDVNTAVSDAVDINEPGQEGASASDDSQPD
ncbi:hypothetical protein [Ornithinimicrobium flavum]|uniref:hypothetical protein n=1 Tax=Ornithinimicrobium flavum TaxID=1288636 RepID=UPI00130536B8|nr:hypothetical protein [Ornithinimicrobium flavum]